MIQKKLFDWLTAPWLPRLFVGLYWLIGVATLRHSAYGFASIESGNIWLGLLSALAVDVLMILFAHGLRNGWRKDYALGLAIPALLSIYTQLLFAVSESQAMTVAPGAEWLEQAQDILRWRIVLLPAALPVLALVASLAGRGETAHVPLVVHNALLARLKELKGVRKQEQESAKSVIENLHAAAQSQQTVVYEAQAKVAEQERQLAEAARRVEAAGVLGKMPQQAQATFIIALARVDERFKTDAETAKHYGLPAYTISKARKLYRKNGNKELQNEELQESGVDLSVK